ncbi:Mpv17-like protein [Microtus ochrogaster]|uniref:Mpv17-like protein n=3 Tax=Microtus ochrogaster TaxID=79684 RepID=A0A8J6KQ80_MICOH|nr:Mpv17-like protein [Microtus ochrogaster]
MANRDGIGHAGWVCIVVSNRPGACGSVRCAGAEGTLGGMASWWRVFPRAAQRYPWPTNVLLYAGLFSAGDALQQRLRGGPADWRQTRRVATLAVTFHGNFNYVWLRLLERALPGRAPRTVLAKVLCDQTVGGPIYLSAFYVGMSVLQGKDDIFLDLKQKFWNTYKSGLMYWPFVQLTNFSLVPVHWRTAYTGLCGFLWATFLCFSQQSGDGTVKSVFILFRRKEASDRPPEE